MIIGPGKAPMLVGNERSEVGRDLGGAKVSCRQKAIKRRSEAGTKWTISKYWDARAFIGRIDG